jgi:uncharacterized damage-inducible protein DinB
MDVSGGTPTAASVARLSDPSNSASCAEHVKGCKREQLFQNQLEHARGLGVSLMAAVPHLSKEIPVKHPMRTPIVAAAILCTAMLRPAAAQNPSIQMELMKDWTDLKTTMDKIVNEMPDDKFSFKPTDPQQTFGERTVHVATVNVGILGSIGGKAAKPTIDAKATTKAAAVKALDESFDYGTALLKEQNDQTILQAVAMPPRFLGPSSRARIYWFLIGHTWDIYGQMAVYLRLSGKVPPASQRP